MVYMTHVTCQTAHNARARTMHTFACHASLERRLLRGVSRRSVEYHTECRSADMVFTPSFPPNAESRERTGNRFFGGLGSRLILANALPLFFSVHRPFRSEFLRTSPRDILFDAIRSTVSRQAQLAVLRPCISSQYSNDHPHPCFLRARSAHF